MIKIAATIGTPDLRTETMALYRGDVATAVREVAALGDNGLELMRRDPAQLDSILRFCRSAVARSRYGCPSHD